MKERKQRKDPAVLPISRESSAPEGKNRRSQRDVLKGRGRKIVIGEHSTQINHGLKDLPVKARGRRELQMRRKEERLGGRRD